MTKVIIKPGACGFTVKVTAGKDKGRKVHLSVETECEMVRKMFAEIPEVDMLALFTRHLDNPVYRAASKHLRHVACPVPGGVLKAAEVASGLNVPKDVSITFAEGQGKPKKVRKQEKKQSIDEDHE